MDGLCSEMVSTDGTVSACMVARTSAVRGLQWTVTPGDGSDRAKEAAELCEYSLLTNGRHAWGAVLDALQWRIAAGFALSETVWAPVQSGRWRGKILPSLEDRPPHTLEAWCIDPGTEHLGGVLQVSRVGQIATAQIPASRLVRLSHRQRGGNFEGLADLRSAWLPYTILKVMVKMIGIHSERWASGIPWAKVTKALNAAQKAELHAALKALRGNESADLVTPDGVEVTILEASGTDATVTDGAALMRFLIAQSMGCHVILAGGPGSSGGGYNVATVNATALADVVDADATAICAALSEDHDGYASLLRQITQWNLGEDVAPPRLTASPASRASGVDRAQAVAQLFGPGEFGHQPASRQRWILQILGAPQAVLADVQTTPAPTNGVTPGTVATTPTAVA